jgi:hypothetical protein
MQTDNRSFSFEKINKEKLFTKKLTFWGSEKRHNVTEIIQTKIIVHVNHRMMMHNRHQDS